MPPPRKRPRTENGNSTMARRVAALEKAADIEFNYRLVTMPTTAIVAGSVTHLTAIPIGTGPDDRIGDKIKLQHVHVRGSIDSHASATATRVRLAVVRANLGTTTIPAITDVWPTVALFAANTDRLRTQQELKSFTVLADMFYHVGQNIALTTPVDLFRKVGSEVLFTGAAATNEGKNAVYLMMAANEATNVPTINLTATVKWSG